MDSGVPLLYVRSRSVDINDRVVELSDAACPADRTEITFVEQLKRWPKDYPR
jgi:GntR family transcriptional regulator